MSMNENDAKQAQTEKRIKDFRRYYDEVGWAKTDEGKPADTVLAVSFAKLQDLYAGRMMLRTRKDLNEKGTYFLDAGCGAVPRSILASGYRYRVCFDFSIQGLNATRKHLGGNGFFVLGDMRFLPFKSNIFDGLCSAYVIYHIPEAENQRRAFSELYRMLKPGCSGIVIYDNPDHLGLRVRRWLQHMPALKSFLANMRKKLGPPSYDEGLSQHREALEAMYSFMPYEPLPGAIIKEFISGRSAVCLTTFSLLTERFKKVWLKDNLLWRIIMKAVFLCESWAGELLWPLAAVWNIVIKKRNID